MRDEGNSSGLALSRYNKQQLTPEEINLKKYFEVRESEKKRIEEKNKQQKERRLQISKRLDSSNVVHRASEKEKEKDKVDVSMTQPEIVFKEEKKVQEKGDWQMMGEQTVPKTKRRRQMGSDSDDSDDSDDGKMTRTKKFDKRRTDRSEGYLDPEVFKPENILMETSWSPFDEFQKGADAAPMELVLENFGFEKYQTLAVILTVPPDSEHYSINITPFEEGNTDDILYHINPRKSKYNNVIFNYRTVTWGKPIAYPLDKLPQLFDTTIELVIQVRSTGFVAFVNGVSINFFKHNPNHDPRLYDRLKLQIPTQDDNGYPCKATFRKVWWGWMEPETDEEMPYGASDEFNSSASGDADTVRTVFVTGLPKYTMEEDKEEVEMYLHELFKEYDIESVTLVAKKGIAFVKVRDPQRCRDAIREKNGCGMAIGDEDGEGEVFYLTLSHSWGRGDNVA